MFTVIICDRTVINDCTNKYKIHFKPLIDNKEIAFCAWYPEGKTLEEAVPELNGIIKPYKEWRAVVINDRHVIAENLLYKPNPFDYVDTESYPVRLSNEQDVLRYREYVKRTANEAVENPIMRLSIWLNGYTAKIRPTVPGEEIICKYAPFSLEYNELLKKENISVVDLETSYARAYRFDTVNSKFNVEGELFCPPQNVIAIAERAQNIELIEAAAAWRDHKEYEYSKFAEDNLYSSKLRCLVYQIPRKNGKIRELDYFKFLSTLLVFSSNDVSPDLLRPERVYELITELDTNKLKKSCNNYIYKLNETLHRINTLRSNKKYSENRKMDDSYVRKEFESDVSIPVKLKKEYAKGNLMCEYKEIGLSKDCPENEEFYWDQQHLAIRKCFVRFLRQPHRSIKSAVQDDFYNECSINDLRAKKLTEFQTEDVVYRLQEEEQNMVETSTSKIFDKKRYDEMLDEADKNIKRGISQRMTKKKTVYLSILLLLLSFFGFIPLLISEFNNLGTGTVSLLLIGVTLGVICVGMIGVLLMLRRQLINRFKHFNYVMSGIYDEIVGSMKSFSVYLSHACNVMREFSVLDIINSKVDVYSNIYKKHEIEIYRCIESVMNLFPEYIDKSYKPEYEVEPFYFDFNLAKSYEYDMEYDSFFNSIDFLNKGNEIMIPIDYIKCIKLKREEFYD